MKKLFALIFLGMVFFIGGQWLGLEMREREHQGGNALTVPDSEVGLKSPAPSAVEPMPVTNPTPLPPVQKTRPDGNH